MKHNPSVLDDDLSAEDMREYASVSISARVKLLADGSVWLSRGPGGLFKEWRCLTAANPEGVAKFNEEKLQ